MKSLNKVFLALPVLITFLTSTHATALFQPTARGLTSYEAAATAVFGGPTPEMKACLKKPECQHATSIYHYCLEGLPASKFDDWSLNPAKNNSATYECLYDTYHDVWRTSFQTCIPCLSVALTNRPEKILPPPANPSILEQVLLNLDSYCLNTHSKVFGLQFLITAGEGITRRSDTSLHYQELYSRNSQFAQWCLEGSWGPGIFAFGSWVGRLEGLKWIGVFFGHRGWVIDIDVQESVRDDKYRGRVVMGREGKRAGCFARG
ncbi:hypothetical protein BKA64DRAFT_719338 [Cadophora sp. MPI-SDFR-AT-0126]|nr:hypothetical protein BKA64DRAFT_719338 [Leotiomycetes sp. MPI-SDFR-AT-0126]